MEFTVKEANGFLENAFAQWVRDLGLEITKVDAESVHMTMPITDHICRVGDIVSGQAMAAMADTTMVFAAIAHAGELIPFATTNLDTQFLRPAVGDHIRCEARVVRAGKSIVFTDAVMIAEPLGKPVSTATATFFAP